MPKCACATALGRVLLGGVLAIAALALSACLSSGGGGGGAAPGGCPRVAGTWSATGCDASSCEITQTACSVNVTCNDGTVATGSVTWNSIQFSSDVSCSASLSGFDTGNARAAGTCTSPTELCQLMASCSSGECATKQTPAPVAGQSAADGGIDGGDEH